MKNQFLPLLMRVDKVVTETADNNIKTFELSFLREEDKQSFSYLPGQFAEVSVFGKGEAPFGIASSPSEPGLKFSVNKTGVLSLALHRLEEGETVGVRGPLGSSYPLSELKGKNLVIISGGFAFTTLRALVRYILDTGRDQFGKITVLYGARNPGLLLYKDELKEWSIRKDINLVLTIDKEAEGWTGKVGLLPNVLKEMAPASQDTYALVCGPPIMIKFTLPVLKDLGFPPERIILSLEKRMKCGVGMCGHCNIGPELVCRDGPVFTLAHLETMPNEEP
ncbi:MAG: FAD/NAD(P)-binding protein [Dehalococcoidales bacterium]|nr:FAD/NAD(P)-binding protein [Dehalococcoidales bacterium]